MDENQQKPPPPRRSRFKALLRALLVILAALILVCAAIVLVIRIGIDGNQAARLLVPRLERDLGVKISVSSAHLAWVSWDTGVFALTDVQVRESPEEPLVLHIPSLEIEVSLKHCFSGVLMMNRIAVAQPVCALTRPVGSEKSGKPSPTRGPLRQVLAPVVRDLRVTDGSLVDSEPDSPTRPGQVLLQNVNVSGHDLTKAGIESLVISAAMPGGAKPGTISVSGHVTSTASARDFQGDARIRVAGCPVDLLKALAAHFNHRFPFAEGTVDIEAQVTGSSRAFKMAGELAVNRFVLLPESVFMGKVALDRGSVRFSVQRERDTIAVELSEVDLPGIRFALETKIDGLSQPDPTVSITLGRADLDLGKVFPFIPLKLLRKEDREKLRQAGLRGHVQITGGSWSGKLSDLQSMIPFQGRILLDAILDRVSGFIPGFGLPVTDATGQIRISSEEVLFKGISLTLGSSPIVLNGWITGLTTAPRIDLFVSMTARAEDLKPILENRVVAAYLGSWTRSIVDPVGGISITLDFKGDLARPEMKGRVLLKDYQCRIENVPLPLKNVNGALRFRGAGLRFADVKGALGDSPLEVKGEVFPDNMDVSIQVKASPADLKRMDLSPSESLVVGTVPVNVRLKGKGSAIAFSATADLKNNGLKIGPYLRKTPGAPFTLEVAGTRDSERIVLEEAYLLVDGSRIHVKARFDQDGRRVVALNFPPKGIPTNILIPFTDPVLELQPGGRFEGDAVIRWDPTHSPTVEANISVNHVSLRLPGFHKRTEGMTGKVRWRPNSVLVTLERSRTGSSQVSGSLSITEFGNPKIEATLESSFLDTTDFTSPPGYVSPTTWGEWIRSNAVIRFLARSRGTTVLKIAKGKTALRAFSDLRVSFEDNKGLVKVPHWQMRFSEGIVGGTGLFDIRPSTHTVLHVDFQGDQMKMDQLLLADPERMRVDGDVSAAGRMDWKLTSSRANNGISKAGSMEVRVHDGTIYRFDILTKVFSLINLGSLLRGRLPDITGQGLPFQRITWDMDVFDFKWKVRRLRLESDAARISAGGMYFSDQGRVDFRVDVSPLVGFDTIFSGLFGNLITKDGKILTTTFRVRGLSDSPDVRLEFENAN